MADYKLILSHIAKALVDKPDEVVVLVVDEDETSVTLELSVAPDDMGKVIGKHGKIAKAIRTVMKALANADGKRVIVDIK
ncbi:MAG: KH domain-containing protein [Clostridia bacterium]|nr:KH domain-containing protein [Clostridia bacterium]